MAEEGFRRKLTAILSADVEGYSRLMGDNEEATVRTLTAYKAHIFYSIRLSVTKKNAFVCRETLTVYVGSF